MRKYQPVPLPKHVLTSKEDKKHFDLSSESSISVLLGPLSLIYLNPLLAVGLAFFDVVAIVLIQFIVSQSFYSFALIFAALVLLIANHYFCAWLRNWLIERRR